MSKVLLWSNTVNERIKCGLRKIETFEGAKECIIKSSEIADIVVVSSANQDAIMREWEEAGLLAYVRFVASQDVGSKVDCLRKICEKGYDTNKVLMVGDARGDYLAAKDNFAHYYQIKYQSELESWQILKNEAMAEFFEGVYQYDGEEVLQLALEDALKVIKCNVDKYTNRFQHVSDHGVYPLEENKLWTMSFYPGQLYLAYDMTKDADFLRNKEEVLKSFSERCATGHMDTHDIGFLFELTAYYDYKFTGNEASKTLLIQATDKLMQRYHKKAAISHARVSGKYLIREDYSSFHTYWMDIQTGKALYGKTHQGHNDESTWVYPYLQKYFAKGAILLCQNMKSY